MNSGQRISYNGYEVCLFPMDYISPSQGYHGGMYASDWVGTTSNYPVYAPFSGTVQYYNVGDNTIWYVSDDKVWTPSGLTYVTVGMTHSNDISPAPWTEGQHFTQGDLLYHTGNKGYSFGDHLHLDQMPRIISQFADWQQYSTPPFDIYYASGTETVNEMQMTSIFGTTRFRIWGTGGNFKWWMARYLLMKKRGGI